ncbi:MAG: hypothetical protein RQ735_11310 [Flavobacteriaceae bacterium]|nr:hypothetical protein [Flavobacteriaceae bacterium]
MKLNRQHNTSSKQDSGFVVPENYFADFSKKMLLRTDLKNYVEGYSKKRNTGFEIPENYFENNRIEILSKLEPAAPKVRKLTARFWRVAAIFTALLGLTYFMKTPTTNIPTEVVVGETDIKNYLETDINLSEFDWEQLLSSDFAFDPFGSAELSGDEMAQYLAENLSAYDYDEEN